MINPELFSKKINWKLKIVVFLRLEKNVENTGNYHDSTLFVYFLKDYSHL